MNSEAESINNFKFLIELSIAQFSEFFNLRLLKNSLALAANSRSLNSEKEKSRHLAMSALGLLPLSSGYFAF